MKKYKLGFNNLYLNLDQIRALIDGGRYMPIKNDVLKVVEGKEILDLGCNIGIFSAALASRYASSNITGIDSASHAIEIAQAVHVGLPNLSFKSMDVTKLEFDNHRFDCVCFLDVLEHINNPIDALREVHRVLKPSGKLILSTNNVYYFRFFTRQVIYDLLRKKPKLMIHDPLEKWNRHIFCWDVSTLCTLLQENGFIYDKHFYTGSSGIYFGDTKADRIIDNIFANIFPYFRATVVVKLTKGIS